MGPPLCGCSRILHTIPQKDSGKDGNNRTKMQEDVHEVSAGQMSGGHWFGISLLVSSVLCGALLPNLQHQLIHGIGGAPSI